jgi:WD40 repeat protein
MREWRGGGIVQTLEDTEPPLGVCSCLQRAGPAVAAGNTFSRSQLRVWDLSTGVLVDRFSLPASCRGVRCLQMVADEASDSATLVAGCANGWLVQCDLRSGRYERKMAHPECINSVFVRGDMLLTAGDDGVVRMTDMRTWGSISSHKIKRVVVGACCDEERLFAGCDDGTVRMYDYSAHAAISIRARQEGGGFTAQQKQAFSAAVEAARRRENA